MLAAAARAMRRCTAAISRSLTTSRRWRCRCCATAYPVAERRDRGAQRRPHPARNPRPDAGAAIGIWHVDPADRTRRSHLRRRHSAGFVRRHLRSEPVGAVVQLRLPGAARGRHRCAAGVPVAVAQRQGRGDGPALYRQPRRHHRHHRRGALAAVDPFRSAGRAARRDRAGRGRHYPPAGRARGAGFSSIVPRRRGKVTVDRIWLRWRGPLGLIESDPNHQGRSHHRRAAQLRGVQSAALQFYTQEAIYGIKTQQQSGEGAEFEALREYAPGLDSRAHRLEAFGAPPQAPVQGVSHRAQSPDRAWPSTPAT